MGRSYLQMHQGIGSAGKEPPGPSTAIDWKLWSSSLHQVILPAVQDGGKVDGETALVPRRIHLMPPVR